jgi:hypothetical protein
MTVRFSSSRALGLAVALTLGTVASAAAQQPSSARQRQAERDRVRKEQQQRDAGTAAGATGETTSGAASGTTGGATGMSGDMSAMGRRDTVVVQCNCGSTTTASAGEVIPLIRPRGPKVFGNGLYAGLSGSAQFPVGDLYKAYNEGWGAAAYVGWDPEKSPFGLRASLGYVELNGRTRGPQIRRPLGRMDIINDFGGAGVDAREFNVQVNGKFRVPFGRFLGATSGAYLLGGAGVHHFRDYNQSLFLTNQFYGRGLLGNADESALLSSSRNANDNITRLGVNGGAGLSLGVGNTELFVESRYHRVYTPNRAINYMPVAIGLLIH